MFMKNNITASENFMSGKVMEFVSFLADRVTKENTMCGSRSEFMRDMHNSSMCKTTKNLKMGIRGNLAIKSFKRSLLGKKCCRQTINQMDSGKNTFCPKTQRKIGLKTKGTGRLKDMTMFAFDNPILLGCINARVLINGAILSKKITYRKEFPPIIDSNFGDGSIKLGFDKREKICK